MENQCTEENPEKEIGARMNLQKVEPPHRALSAATESLVENHKSLFSRVAFCRSVRKMFHWGKKVSKPIIIDVNAPITQEETATILRLAELVPLVPPRQILIMLRQNGGTSDGCIEKLLAMQTQMEEEQAAERRLLHESARLADSQPRAVPAAVVPAVVPPSAPGLDDEKLTVIKKVTEQLAALERTYESSFQVMENKLHDLQVENEAQKAEIALLHAQLKVRCIFIRG